MKYLIPVTFIVLISLSQSLYADSRCNCSPSSRIGSCISKIQFGNNRINITSNTYQCSMVTWYANGEPKITIVTDGKETEEWLGSSSPSLEIGSCDVCEDNQRTDNATNKTQNECASYGMLYEFYKLDKAFHDTHNSCAVEMRAGRWKGKQIDCDNKMLIQKVGLNFKQLSARKGVLKEDYLNQKSNEPEIGARCNKRIFNETK